MPEVSQRLALYKQLSGARDDDELGALRGELLDRYGALPVEAQNLVEVIRLKIRCRRLGVVTVEVKSGELQFQIAEKAQVDPTPDRAHARPARQPAPRLPRTAGSACGCARRATHWPRASRSWTFSRPGVRPVKKTRRLDSSVCVVLAGCGSGSGDDSLGRAGRRGRDPGRGAAPAGRRAHGGLAGRAPPGRRERRAAGAALRPGRVERGQEARHRSDPRPGRGAPAASCTAPDWKDPDPRYRETVRREMILERTALADLGARARVPDSALRAYFEEHKAEYASPARVQIRQIVVAEKPKAEALRGADREGRRLRRARAREQHRPGGVRRGHAAAVREGRDARGLRPRLRARARAQISPVIESPYGFHLFLVESRLPAHEASFDEVREKIALELGERQPRRAAPRVGARACARTPRSR